MRCASSAWILAAALALALSAPPVFAQFVTTFASGQPSVHGLAFSNTGILYSARRTPTNVIVKCVPPDNTMTLFASGLADPVDMVCDAAGNVYVACYNYDMPGGSVVKITPGGVKSTFAVVPNPISLAIDGAGNLYVGRFDRIINKVTPDGTVSVYADLATYTYLGVNGANNHPSDLVLDADGTLWASMSWGAIFKIGPGGSPIAGFNRLITECWGLTRANDGTFYASSYTHNEIWRMLPDGSGSLFAGKLDVAGLVNGAVLSARFNDPSKLVIGAGVLYIADYSNAVIRAVDLAAASPVEKTTWGRVKSIYR